jgi:hypothetical protein
MNPLFEIHGFSYPMIWGDSRSLFQVLGSEPRGSMFVTGLITVLCTAGIAFYVRFLVALCEVLTPRRIGSWVRLRLGSGENAIAELQQRKKPVTRTA